MRGGSAARWAGVSPAAPYRHFRDREELIADVAKRGFKLFSERLREAWGEGKPSSQNITERAPSAEPDAKIRKLVVAYRA